MNLYKRTDYSENMLQNNLDKQSTIEYWADPLYNIHSNRQVEISFVVSSLTIEHVNNKSLGSGPDPLLNIMLNKVKIIYLKGVFAKNEIFQITFDLFLNSILIALDFRTFFGIMKMSSSLKKSSKQE